MRWLSVLVLLLGACSTAPHPVTISEDTLRPYIEFVEANTDYKIHEPPAVISDAATFRRAWSNSTSIFAYSPTAGFMVIDNGRGKPVPVVFIAGDRTAYGSVSWQSSIVHELVHYAQYLAYINARSLGEAEERKLRNRKGWICGASTEREAVTLEIAFLRTRDTELMRRFERVNLAHYSSCPNGPSEMVFKPALLPWFSLEDARASARH